jgi:hypothetical protein
LIERAEEIVGETGSLIGERYLEHARELQARAWEAYRGQNYSSTRKLTLAAREQALKAIGAVQVADYNISTVRRQIDQTDELLKRARDEVGIARNQQVLSLLETARKIQIEAKEFFRSNNLKIALKATLRARETANRAADMADNSLAAEDELHRTDDLIAKAADRAKALGSNGRIQDMLDDAETIQAEAYEKLTSGRLRAAVRQTLRVRDLTKKALRQMEEDIQPERIERFLLQTERMISEVADVLAESPDDTAAGLLEIAEEHHRRATEAFSEGDTQTAIVEAKAARELITKARNMVQD